VSLELLRRGRVWAADRPGATAVVVRDGLVEWVGDEAGAERLADDADQVVELEGRLVTPAFVDAHAHVAATGLAAVSLDLSPSASVADALTRLERYARAASGEVLLGFGWDETRWPESRPFTRAEVDRAVGGRVAYLARVDVHSAVVSTAFVERAPQICTTDGWHPDGRVERAAHHLARDLSNDLVTSGQRRDAIRQGLRAAAAAGIGCVHEMGAPHLSRPADFATIAELSADEVLPVVVPYWGELDGVAMAAELGCVGAAGDLCVDGALGSRTAATSTPYADADTYGALYLSREQVRDHTLACTRAGLQAGFHCIGDRAVAETIAGLEDAARVAGGRVREARHRLEHVEMVDADGIARLSALGVVASVQPAFDATWGGKAGMYAARLGAERSAAMNPIGSMYRAGLCVAFGSDSPVTAFDPWGALRAAVRHHQPAERLTLDAALAAHTVGGWRAARRDDAGRLAPGAPATYAVWDAETGAGQTDPVTLAPDLAAPRCVRTVVEGRVAHELEGALR
jgi:predicted amidohydrolase YtcJ